MMNGKRVSRPALAVFSVFLVTQLALSQGRLPDDEQAFGERSSLKNTERASVQAARAVALESTVDPTRYSVGPSDVLSVNLWITPAVNLILTVTPEGTLIIPTVGELRVADMTLADAKDNILKKVRSKYPMGELTVTLVMPRSVIVTVTGNVLNPGSYTLSSTSRTDKALEMANQLRPGQDPKELEAVMSVMSRRNIVVKRKDGTALRVDIQKFLAVREEDSNPYLREGDLVVVPRAAPQWNVVGVYGAVNVPGTFEFVHGDSMRDALQLAHGFTAFAIADSIELHRMSLDGEQIAMTIINGDLLLERGMADVALEPGDRLLVRKRPDLRRDYRVAIEGEVRHPGEYPITHGSTRLSDVIRQAGGFTDNASLATAQLLRRSIAPGELELERLESARGLARTEDSSYYYLETDLRLRREIVNVDFEGLFKRADSTQDVPLRNGDYLVVPERTRTVYVFGQVVTPGHVPFVARMDPEYYVQQAGGFTDLAREGDLRIVKARTRQWLAPSETSVEEGDYVWVPRSVNYPFSHYLGVIGQTASIVSVGISLVLLVLQLNKD